MFISVNNLLHQYNNIIKNSFYLSIVYGIRLLLPFIAMPYIIRVCGAENYGKIILAQTVAVYFAAFVNLGLPTAMPKEIVSNMHSLVQLSDLTSAFIAIRIALAGLGACILVVMINFSTLLQNISILLAYAYIMVIAEALSLLSIYQGLEKMQNITIINIVAVIFYAATLFTLVKNESDYKLIPLLQSLGMLLSAFIGLVILHFKYNIKIKIPSYLTISHLVKKSIIFALANISSTVNSNISRLFTGISLGSYDLALLDVAQKIYEAAAVPVTIVEQAIFPHNARKKDHAIARQLFWIMFVFSCICAVLLLIGTPVAVNFFGAGKLNAAIPLCYWLSIKVVLTGLNYYTGAPLLVAFGHPKPYNTSIIFSTVVILILSIVFYFMDIFSLPVFIVLLILGDLITFFIRFYYCKKLINIP